MYKVKPAQAASTDMVTRRNVNPLVRGVGRGESLIPAVSGRQASVGRDLPRLCVVLLRAETANRAFGHIVPETVGGSGDAVGERVRCR